MKKNGFKDEPWILANERMIPDLNVELYLTNLLPKFISPVAEVESYKGTSEGLFVLILAILFILIVIAITLVKN